MTTTTDITAADRVRARAAPPPERHRRGSLPKARTAPRMLLCPTPRGAAAPLSGSTASTNIEGSAHG